MNTNYLFGDNLTWHLEEMFPRLLCELERKFMPGWKAVQLISPITFLGGKMKPLNSFIIIPLTHVAAML